MSRFAVSDNCDISNTIVREGWLRQLNISWRSHCRLTGSRHRCNGNIFDFQSFRSVNISRPLRIPSIHPCSRLAWQGFFATLEHVLIAQAFEQWNTMIPQTSFLLLHRNSTGSFLCVIWIGARRLGRCARLTRFMSSLCPHLISLLVPPLLSQISALHHLTQRARNLRLRLIMLLRPFPRRSSNRKSSRNNNNNHFSADTRSQVCGKRHIWSCIY